VGQNIELLIDRLDLNGSGVGRHQKRPVFVRGALPGERIKAKVVEQKSKYLKAKPSEIIKAADARVEPKCRHYGICGGCDLQHLNSQEHLAFKQQKVAELFYRNDISQALPWQCAIQGDSWHYRRKARIGVQYNKKGQAIIGFRQQGSNSLTSIHSCPVLEESLAKIFTELQKVLDGLTTSKSIGHIEAIATDKTTLVIRQLKKLTAHDKTLWLKAAATNSWQLLIDDGQEIVPINDYQPLSYSLIEDIELSFSAKDFIQVNHKVNLAMVEQALSWLDLQPEDKVLDLFCGLGNFSLPIAKRTNSLVGVEGVQAMVDQASKNAETNGIDNCQFYQADLNSDWQEQAWSKVGFGKLVLDPARAGAYEAIEQMAKLEPPLVLYISCDPATLARDSKLLMSLGYQIEKIGLIDMFSQTKHIETMVLFRRYTN